MIAIGSMKFYFFMSCILVCYSVCKGQNFDEKVLADMYQQYTSQAEQSANIKDYAEAAMLMSKLVVQFTEKPHLITQKYIFMLGNAYYRQSCYLALSHKKKLAVKAFTEAVDWGWEDYDQLKMDSSLYTIRNCRQFKKAFQRIRNKKDYLFILQNAKPYERSKDSCKVYFTYMSASDVNLRRLRSYFNLDSVAGQGDEFSRIKNIMEWVHQSVRWDGSSSNPVSQNAMDIILLCRKENRGVNSLMMAIIMNECYLSMGFKSRVVICFPKVFKGDCQPLNIVYSQDLQKWICMDAAYNIYMKDEKGTLLGIAEVRERLQKGLPIIFNEDANFNGEKVDKEDYLYYRMARNLYWFSSALRSEYDEGTEHAGKVWGPYVGLLPKGYEFEGTYRTAIVLYNDEWFWQVPENSD